jgi:hypothetical protein
VIPIPSAVDDQFHGSAPVAAKAWLLIEHPGPWPAFDPPQDLPPALVDYAALALPHGVRTQLIRRTDRGGRLPAAPAATILLAGGPADSRWLVRLAPGALPDLLRVDPARYLDPAPPLSGKSESTVLLVCTHGRREVCCAQFGRPVARALAAEFGPMVWETTHVGGDEFAANVVVLPSGAYFGRMTPKEAVALVRRALDGDLDANHYRGTAGQPAPVQAADCLLRRTILRTSDHTASNHAAPGQVPVTTAW